MNFGNFDEFGNPIGNIDSSEDESEVDQAPDPVNPQASNYVLPDDKKYFPSEKDVYKPYTEVKHEDEDREDYTKPIIAPDTKRKISLDLNPSEIPQTTYSSEFLIDLLKNTASIRNVAFVGALGHGKTGLIDCLVKETHPDIVEKELTKHDITNQVVGEGRRLDRLAWTDRLYLEKRRQLSITTEVMTLIEPDLDGKSYALNLIDTPGHPDFIGQVECGLDMADGVAFCVDIMEGLIGCGKRLLELVISRNLPIILVITKIDRAILEAKYSPDLMQRKINLIVEKVNQTLKIHGSKQKISPDLNNVIFTASQYNLCFTCYSIGLMYMRKPQAEAFSHRMWGKFKVNPQTTEIWHENALPSDVDPDDLPHPFEYYILGPLYKAFCEVISEEPDVWSKTLKIKLSAKEKQMNTIPLLRIALSRIFGTFSSLIHSISVHLPSPVDRSFGNAQIVARVAKFSTDSTGTVTRAYARVFKGNLEPGQKLYALGQKFDDDRTKVQNVTIGETFISHTRYATPCPEATQGMIVLIEGITPELEGVCTLTELMESGLTPIHVPESLMKVSVEALNQNDHQEMVRSLTVARLVYFGLQIEPSISGPGELFLDCVLNDVRNCFASIEVKVSDPFVSFCETVNHKSVTICESPIDESSSIGLTAEPLTTNVMYDLTNGALVDDTSKKLQNNGWSEYQSENVISFGPDKIRGPNILVDETLGTSKVLDQIKPLLVSGFLWSSSEGPLCEEPIRGVLFKLCSLNCEENARIPMVKIFPALRKAVYASMLAATPRLMEPYYHCEIYISGEAEREIAMTILEKRRGKIQGKDEVLDGTPYIIIKADVPLIDMFGMEVDIRARTNGNAYVLSWFSEWRIVESNPLDNSVSLMPLRPAPLSYLGRDFVLKTRRKKGMSEDVDLSKFCSPELLIEIASLTGQ